MRINLVLAFLVLLFPIHAIAAEEWFAIAYQLDRKTREVDVGKSMTKSECVKRQLEIETKDLGWTVRCSRMTQKVRGESEAWSRDHRYLIVWKSDFVRFTEVKNLAQCQQQKASQAQHDGADLVVCAQSYQLIK